MVRFPVNPGTKIRTTTTAPPLAHESLDASHSLVVRQHKDSFRRWPADAPVVFSERQIHRKKRSLFREKYWRFKQDARTALLSPSEIPRRTLPAG
jgi:hypothetical protein